MKSRGKVWKKAVNLAGTYALLIVIAIICAGPFFVAILFLLTFRCQYL